MKNTAVFALFLLASTAMVAKDKIYTSTVWNEGDAQEKIEDLDNVYILPGCQVAFRRYDGEKFGSDYWYFGASYNKDLFWCDTDLDTANLDGSGGIAVYALSNACHYWVGIKVYDNESLNGTQYLDLRTWRFVYTSGLHITGGPKSYHRTLIYALCYKYKLNYNANGNGVTGIPSNWTSGWVTTGYDSSNLQKATVSGARPSRTGYDFLGFYTAASGGTKVEGGTEYTFTNPVHNSENGNVLNLYAHWQIHSHTLSAAFSNTAAGTVTNGSQTKDFGANWDNVTFTPNPGYIITGVTVNDTPVSGWTSSSYTYSGTVPDEDVVIRVSTTPVHTIIISETGLKGSDSAVFNVSVTGETYSYAAACTGSFDFSLSPQKSSVTLSNVVEGSTLTLVRKNWLWAYMTNVPESVSQTVRKLKPETITVNVEFGPKQTWSHTENHKGL